MTLKIHTDGGARGNPGDAAIGVAVFKEDVCIYEHAAYIGKATNNEAEYQGLYVALDWLQNNQNNYSNDTRVVFNLDSKLVVEQVNRNWKIKEDRLRIFAEKCWEIINTLPFSIELKHVRREYNKSADSLVNQALDAHKS